MTLRPCFLPAATTPIPNARDLAPGPIRFTHIFVVPSSVGVMSTKLCGCGGCTSKWLRLRGSSSGKRTPLLTSHPGTRTDPPPEPKPLASAPEPPAEAKPTLDPESQAWPVTTPSRKPRRKAYPNKAQFKHTFDPQTNLAARLVDVLDYYGGIRTVTFRWRHLHATLSETAPTIEWPVSASQTPPAERVA